jgi:DNA-binding MarR family transcriptional regulator
MTTPLSRFGRLDGVTTSLVSQIIRLPYDLAMRPWAQAFANDDAFLMSKIGARCKQLFTAALEPLELKPNHVSVLNYLHAQEGASQRELVEGLWIDASTMVALLDEFEARGLAERRRNPRDRRASAVYLTPTGRDVLARALALSDQVAERLLAPLDGEERAQLHRSLMAIAGADDGAAPTPAAGSARRGSAAPRSGRTSG